MSAIDDLPPLREVIERHGLAPKKSLGQNFLFDLNLTSRIARVGGRLDGVTVIEVGPGPGGLTRALLAEGAARVVAIEKDARAIGALEEISARYPGRLEIVAGDALSVDMARLAGAGPARVVANLPYNVATPLLTGWVATESWPPWWDGLTLMFQREVAERIVAGPGDGAYGRLGVLCGWRCDAKIAFDVGRQAFTPQPSVTSSVVRLTPRMNPSPCDVRDLEAVTLAAFGQRRKMLRQSLKSLGDSGALMTMAGVEPTCRAEEISIEGFAALARARAALSASRSAV